MNKNKKNIIFIVNDLHENGYTKRALDFVNILAKKFNIILMHGNCKVNVNKFLTPEAKQSCLHRVEHCESVAVSERIFWSYPHTNLQKLSRFKSELDEQILDFYKKSVEKYEIEDIYWYSKTNSISPFYIKSHIKSLKVTTVIDYVEDNGDNITELSGWWDFVNKNSKTVIYRWKEFSEKVKCKQQFYLPVSIDVDTLTKNSKVDIWDIDQEIFETKNLKVGFINYYDHNRNGLWSLLPIHNQLIKENIKHELLILGRAPIYWWNYELDFLKENEKYMNEHTHLIGWRSNVAPYIKKMDVIISNTTFLKLGFKVSQTLLEAVALGKLVITTNYNEYVSLKEYGIKYVQQHELHNYLKNNIETLKNKTTNFELFKNDMQKNDEIALNILNKLAGE